MPIDESVIDRPVEEGARLVALELVAECDLAARRLSQGEDEEALHDFRVGLRRLRSTLRAFRPFLAGSLSKKSLRKLREIAQATNAARDAEVQLAWLAGERRHLGRRRPTGIDFLVERYRSRLGNETDRTRFLEGYARLSARLAGRLTTYRATVEEGKGGGPFGGVLARLIAEHVKALERDLSAIEGAADEERVHRARIAAKRLRYLLEPLRGPPRTDAQPAVRRLKALQDLLGNLHDSHVLSSEIVAALVDCAAERVRALYAPGAPARLPPSPRPGLLALADAVRARRDALFAELGKAFAPAGLRALSSLVAPLVEALESRAGGRLERRRRYLLTGHPAPSGTPLLFEVREGLVPGSRLRERIGRRRGPEGERFWRTLVPGPREIEEETTRELFDALWPLTKGHRLEKERRHLVEGGLEIDLDRFLDRDLVLAEVRWPEDAPDAPLPDWLLPHLAREVTDDEAYASPALMARPPKASKEAAGAGAHARARAADGR